MPKIKIRGRIIRILDTRTVIINLGEGDGITLASIFSILGDPEAVVDPFSGEELGRVTVVKSKVKATQVYEKFTIATTKWVERTSITVGGVANALRAFGAIGGIPETRTEVIDEGELRVKYEEVQPWKARSEIPVRVGDWVEVLVELAHASEQEQFFHAQLEEYEAGLEEPGEQDTEGKDTDIGDSSAEPGQDSGRGDTGGAAEAGEGEVSS